MPKVSEEYRKEKIEHILNSAINVISNKPIYELTMLDVIKEANISKGGIYLYFKDIDELLVETINKIASKFEIEQEYSGLCDREGDARKLLIEIFENLGDYIDHCPVLIGKIQFELMVLISNNPSKMDTIMTKLKLKNFGNKFMEDVETLIRRGVEQGSFNKEVDISLLMENISVYIDGITNRVVASLVYKGASLSATVKVHFNQYAHSIIALLEK